MIKIKKEMEDDQFYDAPDLSQMMNPSNQWGNKKLVEMAMKE